MKATRQVNPGDAAYGNVVTFPNGEHTRSSTSEMPVELVDYWDQRIRADLDARSSIERKWAHNRDLIRNRGGGMRTGNIVAEFVGLLHKRLLSQDFGIHINSDDPMFIEHAEAAEITAQSVSRIIALRDAAKKAIADAAWATFGVLEFGHPLDPRSHDPMRSYRAPYSRPLGVESDLIDTWAPVSPEELLKNGVDPNSIEIAQEGVHNLDQMADTTPRPLLEAQFGYPWVTVVDPHLIVMPTGISDPDKSPYYCRLRFLTRAEIKQVQNVDLHPAFVNGTRWKEIFEKSEQEGDFRLFPEMCLVAEVFIRRDRNNPSYNGWYFSYILGHPEAVISSGPNHYGGMRPLVFLQLDPLKGVYGTSLAEELAPYANIYSMGMEAFKRDIKRMMNRPVAVGNGAGLNKRDEINIQNPEFKGIVKMQDVDQVKELFADRRVDNDLLRSMAYFKSVAQGRAGVSDLDQGSAIKDITARQTQALLDATGINVEGMADSVSMALRDGIYKMMHLVGLYSTATRAREYNYGNRFAAFDRGRQDFITSLIYEVEIKESKDAASAEELMLFVQFLKIVLTNPMLAQYYDIEFIARTALSRFEMGPRGLASRSPNRAGQGLAGQGLGIGSPGIGQGSPFSEMAGQPPPAAVNDDLFGQHSERGPGDQGTGSQQAGNMIRGGFRIGTGLGES